MKLITYFMLEIENVGETVLSIAVSTLISVNLFVNTSSYMANVEKLLLCLVLFNTLAFP